MIFAKNKLKIKFFMASIQRNTAGLLLTALLGGCGSLSQINDSGASGDPVFPIVDSENLSQGAWPNLENLRKMHVGMSKDQVYQLLGPPHFQEGMFGVREWDYFFHIPRNGEILHCQYKVIFNKGMLAGNFYWKTQACKDTLNS